MHREHGNSAPPSKTEPHSYRPDIDGLRAVAVLCVVGYHAFPNRVRGGMVGVDIFFVISGFLITGIILQGLAANRFSFLDFYARRVRRIFPALALVLATCLVGGWFLLYDVEYEPLATHVAGGAAFISNFLLSNEAGYFDSQSDYKELLHLWSLGIEEQFYLLFPLLLFLFRRNVRASLLLICALLVASFAYNVWLIGRAPTETYYSPATRFWELMIGAALAFSVLFSRRSVARTTISTVSRELCTWIGVALIALALSCIDDSSAFPGWLALLPTLGAVLILAAGPLASFNRYVLSSRPMVLIGLISYPLYLWHWPLLSFQKVLTAESPGRISRALVVVLSLVLAYGTCRALELPLRGVRKLRTAAAMLCVVVASIGIAGLFIASANGLPARTINASNVTGHQMLSDSIRQNEEIRHRYPTKPCTFPADLHIQSRWCETFGDDNRDVVVLWGDSHAAAWAPAFYEIAQRRQLKVVRFSIGGCPPLLDTRRIDAIFAEAPCGQFGLAEQILEAIRLLKPTHIVLLARWSLYTPFKLAIRNDEAQPRLEREPYLRMPLDETLDALPKDIPITIMRTAPVIRDDPARALLRHTAVDIPFGEYTRREAQADAAIDAASSHRANVSTFRPGELFCKQTCSLTLAGIVLYANATHLSAQGALLGVDPISKLFPATILAHEQREASSVN